MIVDCKDQETEVLWMTGKSRKFSAIRATANRKLAILDAANELQELRVPPGNMLEKLKGNREGQHSIRINDQHRICFVWKDNNAHAVEIVDYH
ncbi:type II toxin-antitoxin system RelE/ParE family toxin [Acidobacterium sp. S8]|uniref:type II toxin-antitoxin system RelE/ParE family toxin n=1 Tax=Acidobacterium sp. S8 TaxID=1641854 RepID=UPI00131E8236|nr:type II toxin-antitoxin system RelE/ParE family toxin [Acidobacterium sp. S8]